MIVQIGTDIVEIEKLKYSVTKEPFASDPFIRHTFTEKEIRLALLRSDPLSFFATRFAGKEAVFKALNITEKMCGYLKSKYFRRKMAVLTSVFMAAQKKLQKHLA